MNNTHYIQVQALIHKLIQNHIARINTHTHTLGKRKHTAAMCLHMQSQHARRIVHMRTHTRAAQRSSLGASKQRENIKCKFFLSCYIKMQPAQTKCISIMTLAWCAYGALASPRQALHVKWAAAPAASFMNSRGFRPSTRARRPDIKRNTYDEPDRWVTLFNTCDVCPSKFLNDQPRQILLRDAEYM